MGHTRCENLSYPFIPHILSTSWQAPDTAKPVLIFTHHMFTHHPHTTQHNSHIIQYNTHTQPHVTYSYITHIIMPHIIHSHTNITHNIPTADLHYHTQHLFHTLTHYSYIPLISHITHYTFTFTHTHAHNHTHDTFLHLFSVSPRQSQTWNP